MSTADWRQIQSEATIIDLHIHPSMQQELFARNLNVRYIIKRMLRGNPFQVRASFPRLRDGSYDVILSALHVPEKGIRKDFPLIGEVELRYDALQQRCVYEPVSIQPRVLVPKVIRDDNRYVDDNKNG